MKLSKVFPSKVPNYVMKRELGGTIYPTHMIFAFLELGVKETTPVNPRITEYFKRLKLELDQNTSWCGAFAAHCMSKAYSQFTNYPELCQSQEWLNIGKETSPLFRKIGDIAIFTNKSNPKHGHVGFFVDETDKAILLLGGNQGNSVNYTWFNKDGKTMKFNCTRSIYE